MMRARALGWAAIAVAWGCTTQQAVLTVPVVTSCDTAWLAPAGSDCAFDGMCNRVDPASPTCCSDTVYCANGAIVADHACNPDCSPCATDNECAMGAAICTNGRCMPCAQPAGCAPCPPGWESLERNGCATCECAPPSQCTPDGSMPGMPPPPPPCGPQEQCYPGKRCAPGCAPGDDCCANTCAAPGCPSPAPVGCFMACPNMPCNQCAADACECMPNGEWFCTPRCLDPMPVSLTCSV